MDRPDQKKRITIIGTGLIGGSLGMALKAKRLPALEIVGHDADRTVSSRAEKLGAFDRAEHNLPRAISGAGMVIIAVPVLSVRDVMKDIAAHVEEGVVVTDTTSTKAHVMAWARELLPERVNFIGGHPMAGKENAGIDNAEAGLFSDKAYCICPAVDASESSVRSVVGLARLVGAQPMFIDADEHDIYAAAVSHLPLMMSTALFSMLRASPAWTDMGMMASSGFQDATRLASGDPAMTHGIWVTNREAVIHWLERMIQELRSFRDMLTDAQDETLLETFYKAQADREVFLREPPQRRAEAAGEKVDTSQAFLSMLVGGMLAKNIQRAKELPELSKEPSPASGAPSPAGGAKEEPKRRPSFGDRVAEGVRRDLEKLEQQRAKNAGNEQEPPGDEK